MRLTPLDIRKQQFKKGMRGLDSDEVYAFLATVADEYESVLSDAKALRDRVLELDDKVQEYRNMERTLRDTLLTAERVTVEAKDNARREADLLIKEAELEAARGVRHIKETATQLRREIQTLRQQRDNYLARMKMHVESHLKMVQDSARDFQAEDERIERQQQEWEQSDDRALVKSQDRKRHAASRNSPAGAASTAPEPEPEPQEAAPARFTTPSPDPPADGPAGDARATAADAAPEAGPTARAALDVLPEGDSAGTEPAAGSPLNEILDRMIEQQQVAPSAPAGEAAPPGRVDAPAAPVSPPAGEGGTARDPQEWSLEKLKKDILSRPAGDDEAH